mgnify:CR=1 FL=1|jgi:hypothetical protein
MGYLSLRWLFVRAGVWGLMKWSTLAEASLSRVPFFVRPFVRRRAEALARERGLAEVTEALMKELRQKEHTGG